jgi:hypothetical protein
MTTLAHPGTDADGRLRLTKGNDGSKIGTNGGADERHPESEGSE